MSREVIVHCTWESEHTIAVPDDTPKIESGELDKLLDASGEDVYSNIASLTDWDIKDNGPSDG